MLDAKLAITGSPTRIVGNKAIFQHGDRTDIYNTDVYRIVPESEPQQEKDTLSWISQACDGDDRGFSSATLEMAIQKYEQVYGQT